MNGQYVCQYLPVLYIYSYSCTYCMKRYYGYGEIACQLCYYCKLWAI